MAHKEGILIGTHYEYPFGGMATRPEWLPQEDEDWRRDLEMIKDTGFDSIRIRIGLDSSLDEVGRLLDICLELEIGVLFGFATFYVHNRFIEAYPDARVIDRSGAVYLIPTFALGRSYFSSLHRGLRRLIRGWLPDSLSPDVTVQGVPDEYRSLVEARLVESDRGSLLFLINRSGYDWEVEVQPSGYQAERVRLPTHGATHRLVRRITEE